MKRSKKNRSKSNDYLVIDAINAMKNTGKERIKSDVQGSYVGSSDEGDVKQDEDDL